MPILVLLSIVLQIACAVHVVRSGRPMYWLAFLFVGSYVAIAVYLLTAIIPDFSHDPRGRTLGRQVLQTIDPERRRRAIQDKLAVADTIDNRRALAEECMRLGDFGNAAELYRSTLQGIYATEPHMMLGLAQAQAGVADFAAARATLDALIQANPQFNSSDGHLLYARCLDELGEHDASLHEYEVLATSFPGEEARYRYAGLLQRCGRREQAVAMLEEILNRSRIAPRFYRRKEQAWISAAKRELASLGTPAR